MMLVAILCMVTGASGVLLAIGFLWGRADRDRELLSEWSRTLDQLRHLPPQIGGPSC